MNYKCKIIAQLVKLTILITILTFLGNVLIIGQLPWFFEKAGDCGLESDITICGDEKPSLYLDEAEYIATGSWTFPFLRKLISSYFGEESTRTTSFEFLRKIMNPYFKADCGSKRDIILFTNEELSRCNGEDNQELYLAILGVVYDVTKGKKHYGPGESYHAFIGKRNEI